MTIMEREVMESIVKFAKDSVTNKVSKKDYFAGLAMQALIAKDDHVSDDYDLLAKVSFMIANSMMEAAKESK